MAISKILGLSIEPSITIGTVLLGIINVGSWVSTYQHAQDDLAQLKISQQKLETLVTDTFTKLENAQKQIAQETAQALKEEVLRREASENQRNAQIDRIQEKIDQVLERKKTERDGPANLPDIYKAN